MSLKVSLVPGRGVFFLLPTIIKIFTHFFITYFSAWLIPVLWLIYSYVAYLYGRDEIYPYLKWSENEENALVFKFALFLITEATILHFVLCFFEYAVRRTINYFRATTEKSQEDEELL